VGISNYEIDAFAPAQPNNASRVTLPGEIVEAAGLVPQQDLVDWRFESGEIRGRKLAPAAHRPGRIATDRQSGLLYWEGDVTAGEAEDAALSANFDRTE
jgi:hypothetical protein